MSLEPLDMLLGKGSFMVPWGWFDIDWPPNHDHAQRTGRAFDNQRCIHPALGSAGGG